MHSNWCLCGLIVEFAVFYFSRIFSLLCVLLCFSMDFTCFEKHLSSLLIYHFALTFP